MPLSLLASSLQASPGPSIPDWGCPIESNNSICWLKPINQSINQSLDNYLYLYFFHILFSIFSPKYWYWMWRNYIYMMQPLKITPWQCRMGWMITFPIITILKSSSSETSSPSYVSHHHHRHRHHHHMYNIIVVFVLIIVIDTIIIFTATHHSHHFQGS